MPHAVFIAICWLLISTNTQAVIFFSTGDPEHNTTTPTGSLTNSGWQWQGEWSAFLGTPIAPRYFLAARHVGVGVGQPFFYQGLRYETTAAFISPDTDLAIFRVDRPFPDFAPMLEHTNNLVGKQILVIGRGTQRGTEVSLGGKLHGWQWGSSDNRQRWGLNSVSGLLNIAPAGQTAQLLMTATFDAAGGPEECTLSGGDSSGAVFINDNGVWSLAGINNAVDSPFNTVASGGGFYAALFDYGGYFVQSGGSWAFVTDRVRDIPGSMYASLVPANLPWIRSILDQPLPLAPVLEFAADPSGPFSTAVDVVLKEELKTIQVPLPSEKRFFRLNAERGAAITSVDISGGMLTLRFEERSE